MALKKNTCGVVYHACQARAHCPTMVSTFKILLRTVSLPRFCSRTGHLQ